MPAERLLAYNRRNSFMNQRLKYLTLGYGAALAIVVGALSRQFVDRSGSILAGPSGGVLSAAAVDGLVA